jgi:hypothetical protein
MFSSRGPAFSMGAWRHERHIHPLRHESLIFPLLFITKRTNNVYIITLFVPTFCVSCWNVIAASALFKIHNRLWKGNSFDNIRCRNKLDFNLYLALEVEVMSHRFRSELTTDGSGINWYLQSFFFIKVCFPLEIPTLSFNPLNLIGNYTYRLLLQAEKLYFLPMGFNGSHGKGENFVKYRSRLNFVMEKCRFLWGM